MTTLRGEGQINKLIVFDSEKDERERERESKKHNTPVRRAIYG